MLTGKWTYRSYLNDQELVGGDAQRALSLIFGEGIMEYGPIEGDAVKGELQLGPGYTMTLEGTVDGESFSIRGEGVDGTPTAGWRYDYRGQAAYTWPEGEGQVPSLLGSVIRVVAHGGGAAGYTASFIAIRHPEFDAA